MNSLDWREQNAMIDVLLEETVAKVEGTERRKKEGAVRNG